MKGLTYPKVRSVHRTCERLSGLAYQAWLVSCTDENSSSLRDDELQGLWKSLRQATGRLAEALDHIVELEKLEEDVK